MGSQAAVAASGFDLANSLAPRQLARHSPLPPSTHKYSQVHVHEAFREAIFCLCWLLRERERGRGGGGSAPLALRSAKSVGFKSTKSFVKLLMNGSFNYRKVDN